MRLGFTCSSTLAAKTRMTLFSRPCNLPVEECHEQTAYKCGTGDVDCDMGEGGDGQSDCFGSK